MRPWCNSTRSQHPPPRSLQSVSRALSPPCAGPPPRPAARVCPYVSEDEWLGPPLPRPRLHTPIRPGVTPGQAAISAHPNGGRGRVHRPRPPSIGQGTPPGHWPREAHVAWRGAINPWELPIAHPRSHPAGRLALAPPPRPTQPHVRQRRASLETPQTLRRLGSLGALGPPRGARQQAAKQPPAPVQGEIQGVRSVI